MDIDVIMLRLSIIIPMYNIEKYIGRCLASCISQNINKEEYEILVIDDGSTDNSAKIVQSIISQINIVVISQNNRGLSEARNVGINNARGKYIWFVDGDDFIEPNCLFDVLYTVENNDLDILAFGLKIVHDNKTSDYTILDNSKMMVLDGKTFLNKVKMPPACWCVIFKTEYLKQQGLFFYPNIYYEDYEFMFRAYFLAKKVQRVNLNIYNYYQRTGSVMKAKGLDCKRSNDWLIVASNLNEFVKNNVEKTNKCYYLFLNKISFAFSQSIKFYQRDFFSVDRYKQCDFYPLSINNQLTLKEIVKFKIMNVSLSLYITIKNIYDKIKSYFLC